MTTVEDVTQAPEMLGGRVKTLHPRIHAGILARRNLDEDVQTLAEHEIEPFDLVCVNLYPFAAVAARRSATEAEVVEMIDVGGPSMLRAAAKNFAHVAAVSSETQYDAVLAALREHGEVPLDTEARARTRRVRGDGCLRVGDRDVVRRDRELPRPAHPDLPQGDGSLVRREPAPGRGVLSRGRHAAPPAVARRPARRQGAVVQQPRRPRGRPPPARASSRCPPW